VSVRDLVVWILLAAGASLVLMSSLGVLVMRGVYDRLHFTGPAALGGVAIAAAVVVREPLSQIGNKALLLAVFLLCSSPVLVHTTARVARARDSSDKRPEVEVL
jgi:multicomponent Na+:H+ antiporter subunit G